MRVASSASMTTSSGKTLVTIEMRPRTTRDTWGKPRVGCSRANALKKYPSRAAAYGTREYPSSSANTDPNALQRIMTVNTAATPGP